MSGLKTQIQALAFERMEDYLYENFDIDKSRAFEIVRNLNFKQHRQISEYLKEHDNKSISKIINEATVDRNPSLTSGTSTSGNNKQGDLDAAMAAFGANDDNDNATPNMQQTTKQPATPTQAPATPLGGFNTGDTVDYTDQHGKPINGVTVNRQLDSNTYELQTPSGKLRVHKDQIQPSANDSAPNKGLSSGIGAFAKGIQKGNQLSNMESEEASELSRLRELAGIEETCSSGATGAGAVAVMPSVAGNTSHPPTERLRAKLRQKKLKKKKD